MGGSYFIQDVAPGQYVLSIPVFSRRRGKNSHPFGVFWDLITVPSREEFAKDVPPGASIEEFILSMTIDPPFYRYLGKGDKLPDFSAETLSGLPIGNASIKGKRAILIFYYAFPDQFPDLSDDINRTFSQAKQKGIEVYCLNVDEEKLMATRCLQEHPLSCEVAWIGSHEKQELMKKFGVLWGRIIISVNPDGTIGGRFEKASDALASFD